MGRSPSFSSYVRPIPDQKELIELNNIFTFIFSNGTITQYEDGSESVLNDISQIYIKIIYSEYEPQILERSCSVYKKEEDNFPRIGRIYRISSAIIYNFSNEYSSNKTFYYKVLELQNIEDDYYTTFCLRTDGVVLNNESFTKRGCLLKLVVASSIGQLIPV